MASEEKDPTEWTTDEVVKFLCNPDSAPWASSKEVPRPDPVEFEASLRENVITGEILLHDVDNQVLRDDLGVKAFGHRSSVVKAIEWLQNRSAKYQSSRRDSSAEDLPATNSAFTPSQVFSPPIEGLVQSYPHQDPSSEKSPHDKRPIKRRIAPTLMQGRNEQSSRQSGFASAFAAAPVQSASPSVSVGTQNIPKLPPSFADGLNEEDVSSPEVLQRSLQQGRAAKAQAEELFFSRLLEKYPPQEDEEDMLPRYGDSGSEGEFDQTTWQEIQQERPRAKPPTFSREAYESIVSECIREQELRWRAKQLPKYLPIAPHIWQESRNDSFMRRRFSANLAHVSSRLDRLKEGIISSEYSSRSALQSTCGGLQPTVDEVCYERWRLSVLDEAECPEFVEPPPRVPRPRRSRRDSEDDDESETLTSDSDLESEDSESEDSGSTDFIVPDSDGQGTTPQSHARKSLSRARKGPARKGPFALVSSSSSEASESSQPARKRRRVSGSQCSIESDAETALLPDNIDVVDLTRSPGAMSGMDTGPPPEASTESPGTGEMKVETPPLNPIEPTADDQTRMEVTPFGLLASQGSDDIQLDTSPGRESVMSLDRVDSKDQDEDVDEETLVKTPPLNPVPARKPKLSQSWLQSPTVKTPVESDGCDQPFSQLGISPDDAEGVDPEYAALFEEVSALSMDAIEVSKNRLHLLAKSVMALRARELQEFPQYLSEILDTVHLENVHMAVLTMMNNRRVPESATNGDPKLSMRLGALFVSWHNCVGLTPADGLSRAWLQGARASLEKDDNKIFTSFMDRVRDLITAYNQWKPKETTHKSANPYASDSDDWQVTDLQSTGPRKSKKKSKQAPRTLSHLQKNAQQRQAKQDRAREAFRKARESQGLSNNDPTGQAVTFKDPVIYLNPLIGEFVKPHQLVGIQFMWRELCEADKPQGCLLAHVMGLGKTMQVISFLVTVSEAAASENPKIRAQVPTKFHQSRTLILCPSSLVQNWTDEFAIWAPPDHRLGNIREIIPRGRDTDAQDRLDKVRAWDKDGGILIMSYDVLRITVMNKGRYTEEDDRMVQEALLSKPNIVVADEAHKLKSEKSAISQVASRFKTMSRIAMTGSPLANSLFEYFQMLEWTAPGYLENISSFKSKFVAPIQAGSYIDSTVAQRRESLVALQLLNGILSPKIHRADASVIAADLPPKTEFIIWVPLTDLQKEAYNSFVGEVNHGDAGPKLWQWLALMQLCCNHPHPFLEKLADRSKASEEKDAPPSILVRSIKDAELPPTLLARVENLCRSIHNLKDPCWSHRAVLLNRILDEAKRVGDKVLVFSQSIPTLNYLDYLLNLAGRRYQRIDGNLPASNRQSLTKAFNTGNSIDIMLISTRAGGLGLNMFGANRVVIFDFLFNPTWEDQAVGRAYRLGQTKPVFVYRFVAGGTFEDIIFNATVFKSQLAVRVVDKKSVLRESRKKSEQYLFPVRPVEKDDDSRSLMGKDPEILDKILSEEFDKRILKVTLSRIQDDENDRLTEEERRHVDKELRMERLKRSDPAAYERELNQQKADAWVREQEERRVRKAAFERAQMRNHNIMLLDTIRSSQNQNRTWQGMFEYIQAAHLQRSSTMAHNHQQTMQTQGGWLQHWGISVPPLSNFQAPLPSGVLGQLEQVPDSQSAQGNGDSPAPTTRPGTMNDQPIEWVNPTPHEFTLSESDTPTPMPDGPFALDPPRPTQPDQGPSPPVTGNPAGPNENVTSNQPGASASGP